MRMRMIMMMLVAAAPLFGCGHAHPTASQTGPSSASNAVPTQITTTALPAAVQGQPPMVIDDFESYEQGSRLPWHKAPHGNRVDATIGPNISGQGRQSMKLTYQVQPGRGSNYVALMRYQKWDLSGYNALAFWIKPDGQGHSLGLTLNMLDDQGRQHWNLWNASFEGLGTRVGETAARRVVVPFSSLRQDLTYSPIRDVSSVFKPSNITEIVFFVAAKNDRFGEGVLYIDDVEAVVIDEP